MKRMSKFAESIERARKLLELSYRDLELLTGFSEKYLRLMIEGRQIPQVEGKILETLTVPLAERAVDAVLISQKVGWRRSSMIEGFIRIVKQFAMTLDNVIQLSNRASQIEVRTASKRLATANPNIDIWDSLLLAEANVLANPTIEMLLEEDVVHVVPFRTTAPSDKPRQCDNCHKVPQNQLSVKCPECGYQWNHQDWN